MSDTFDIEKLREEVNPVFSTAQSCVQILAFVGDADAKRLLTELGLEDMAKTAQNSAMPREVLEVVGKSLPAFNSRIEMRFLTSNSVLRAMGAKQVVDLPCGYTPRAIKLAGSGIRYFGFDLPAVIDEIKPATERILGGSSPDIIYSAVDATNYSSLRTALAQADGPLHITTEGLLMYLTQSELETVFENIRKLLLEFGGRWVTVDSELGNVQAPILERVNSGMTPEQAVIVRKLAAGGMAKTTLDNNDFCDQTRAKQFVSDMGFDLELLPAADYMPEDLRALAQLPEDVRGDVRDLLGSVNFWSMTPKADLSEDFSCEQKSFKADINLRGDTMKIQIAGHLDTLTAPDLLALYKRVAEKGGISSVSIDMKDLDYISSAGLRVLLIIRKDLGNGNHYSLTNMKPNVEKIIQTTGFDSILC